MKKNIIISLSISLFSMLSIQISAISQSKMSKKNIVEKSLSLPIRFNGEKTETYTIEERMHHHKTPGFSFALINNGQVEWADGYGALSNKSNVPVTKETLFQAASIAKPVTAYAVMRMHEKKYLDINENVQ
ncbi:MAG: beta-lactamase family protein, partial [Kangiellaceae bacterium]|nr:beta-lactamase family protein [Kangiellaceae bacterium]